MDHYLITFRSVTPAQRGENILRKAGISCAVVRTPKVLADRGCGYSLRMPMGQAQNAVELLRLKGIHYGKVYSMFAGNPEEVRL